MQCPHCSISSRDDWISIEIIRTSIYLFRIYHYTCEECQQISIKFGGIPIRNFGSSGNPFIEKMLIPETITRKQIPKGVETEFLSDYNNAVKLLPHSFDASAAYSRRLLQHYIEKKHEIKRGDLQQEIQELKKLKCYPADLVDLFDLIRHYGKFGSHATTDQLSGEIIEVDNDEADLLLHILEEMFDYDYERPKRIKEITKKLQKKLRDSKPKKDGI